MIRPRTPRISSLPAGALLAAFCPAIVLAAPPPAGSAVLSAASHCAATAEAAARGIVSNSSAGETTSGYRVQDLVIDSVLRKAYVRVADCQDPRKPLTLVALDVQLPGSPVPPFASTAHSPSLTDSLPLQERPDRQNSPTLPLETPVIRRGDAVEIVVRSSTVHMTLHGHAAQAAPLNASVDVELDREPGSIEPARHMQGIAAAAGKVEVTR